MYYEREAQRQKQLSHFILVIALMMEFSKRADCYTHYVEDDDDRIEELFFAKVLSLKILKYNYNVLLMDAMYKTNKYKMSLIVIDELMPLNTSYYIVFEFV